jgi:aconitate hydratase
VIAAITSCTNTSNPGVLIAAGLVAARRTSWASSQAVGEDLARARIAGRHRLSEQGRPAEDLDNIGFNLVGYGCTTCIGNSGPLPSRSARRSTTTASSPPPCSRATATSKAASPDVRANFLASPPLVVAYALAGTVIEDFTKDPRSAGQGRRRLPQGHLADQRRKSPTMRRTDREDVPGALCRRLQGRQALAGDQDVTGRNLSAGRDKSTYVANPPYFEGMSMTPAPVTDIVGAKPLAILGDSITTDHISPAGSTSRRTQPAGKWLMEPGRQGGLQLLRRAPRPS